MADKVQQGQEKVKDAIVVQPDAQGKYHVPGVTKHDIARIDIADTDIVLQTKDGAHYILPEAGIAAMSDPPAQVVFSDGQTSTDQLLGEIGAVLNLDVNIPIPSSFDQNGTPQQQQQQNTQQNTETEKESGQVSALHVDPEATVESLVQAAQQTADDLHSKDYDYVAPHQFEPPPSPVAAPPGVPPPISLTPIVTLFMGNVVGVTSGVVNGVTTYYGGGGAVGSDATAQIGPRDALQFSPATIDESAVNSNIAIYAEGPLVGNSNPAMNNSALYTKQFILNVAGYFTALNNITIKNVPAGVSFVGATNNLDGSWTLPASAVLNQSTFTMVYSTAGTGTFDLEFDVSGLSTRGVTFQSDQTFRFEYMAATSSSQITDPTLVYDNKGLSQEIYVLPTLDQPNIISAGDGNDTIVGSRSNDTITTGNGNSTITDGGGNDTITTGNGNNTITAGSGTDVITVGSGANTIVLGDGNDTIVVGNGGGNNITVGNGSNSITTGVGNNTISTGNGNNTISVGAGSDTITTGSGADSITTAGGGGTINAGAGNNTITINSTAASTDLYTITTTGAGTNVITGGDDNYVINMGTGTNTVTLGNSTSTGNGTTTFDTTITLGAGTNTVTTGNGIHEITVGAGVSNITTGSGTDVITAAGGGGSINAGSGNNTITVNSTSGSTDTYTLTTSGTGTTTINAGDDNYTISASSGGGTITTGTGVDNITTAGGNYTVTTTGGGGSISTGQGNVTINVNSTSGSTKSYTLTSTGTGTTNITAGDNNYTITAGSGANTISIGNGNSSITATGAGADTITTGNGTMLVSAGSGNASSVTVGSGTTATDVATVSIGNGNNDTVTANGSAASSGAIAIGSGSSDTVTVGSGSYTITVGGANGVTNTLTLSSGSGDHVTVGNGNNTIYVGTSTSGTDTLSIGNGNNSVYVGGGTNSITAGTGSNILNFGYLTSHLTGLNFGTTGTSTAAGSSVSDSFTGFNTVYGTNYGDTVTMNTGTLSFYGGSGNDSITLGSGTDTVYAGNGNNSIVGTNLTTTTLDHLYGGTGNNTFTSPDAGTTYNGTNGANLTLVANNQALSISDTAATNPFVYNSAAAVNTPTTIYTFTNAVTGAVSSINYTYSGGVASIYLDLGVQINKIDYSTDNSTITVNLANGTGVGGTAQGSSYVMTPTTGYSSINEIVVGGGNDFLTPSSSDTVLIAGKGQNTFTDTGTLATQVNILEGDNTTTAGGNQYYYMGAAQEIVVASTHSGWNYVSYTSAPAGIVVNLDDQSHTFSSTVYTTTLTVAAYSGANWGADANTATGSNANSWSAGDYFVPVAGLATDVNAIVGSALYSNLVYGGTNFLYYYAGYSGGSNANYFYAGSGGSIYIMNGGADSVATVLTAGGTNVFDADSASGTTYNNALYVILNRNLDTGTTGQPAKEAGLSLTYGGTTYTSFAYGWGNVSTPVGNSVTFIAGYENVIGGSGNDYIVGDNNNNQINAEGGSNTIILGDGTNIITAIQGSNTIIDSTYTGQTIGTNTLNFETTNDGTSGIAATYSGTGSNTSAEVFLNYTGSSTQSTFFGAGGDETAFYGSSTLASAYQARTGTASFSYSAVQAGIIHTINGSDYTSSTTDVVNSASFSYDNVYSGASVIIGHSGNNVFIDNIGTAAESFTEGSGSNIFYATATQIPDLTVVKATSVVDILRVEGWGDTTYSGNAFGGSDPFSTTKIAGITDLDVRSGVDAVGASNILTVGGNSVTNVHNPAPTFNLSAVDVANLVSGTSSPASTPTLVLKLDSGEVFTPTGTVSTSVSGSTTSYYNSATQNSGTLIATDVHNGANYYADVVTFANAATQHNPIINIHYGTG